MSGPEWDGKFRFMEFDPADYPVRITHFKADTMEVLWTHEIQRGGEAFAMPGKWAFAVTIRIDYFGSDRSRVEFPSGRSLEADPAFVDRALRVFHGLEGFDEAFPPGEAM